METPKGLTALGNGLGCLPALLGDSRALSCLGRPGQGPPRAPAVTLVTLPEGGRDRDEAKAPEMLKILALFLWWSDLT